MEYRLHTKPRVPVIVKISVDVSEKEYGDPKYLWEQNCLCAFGLDQDSQDKQLFHGRLTENELAKLSSSDETFTAPSGKKIRYASFIARVTKVHGHNWQCHEGGEYLVEKGLTLRLRHTTRYNPAYNHYAELHLFTDNGWVRLGKRYLGGDRAIIAEYRLHYEQLRRSGEVLVDIGATVSSGKKCQKHCNKS